MERVTERSRWRGEGRRREREREGGREGERGRERGAGGEGEIECGGVVSVAAPLRAAGPRVREREGGWWWWWGQQPMRSRGSKPRGGLRALGHKVSALQQPVKLALSDCPPEIRLI